MDSWVWAVVRNHNGTEIAKFYYQQENCLHHALNERYNYMYQTGNDAYVSKETKEEYEGLTQKGESHGTVD